VRFSLIAALGLLAVAAGSAAAAQTAPPQVGIPGCGDDVAVQASRTLVSFESRGRPIRAYLYAPRGEPNGAALVMLHGGTGFEMNSILFDAHAIQLASRGYWVMLPAYFDADAPAQGRRLVNARAWRQAALDAAATLAGKPGVSPDRVALWGYSRGAGVALNAATSPEGSIRSTVLVAGGGEVDGRLGDRNLSFLLMHARRDEAVPVRATLDLAAELRAAGAGVEVQALDFDGHQYDLPTWCSVMGRTRAFLEGGPGGGAS
jgi:dienelactone hydrolase